ncbi:MAG: glucose-1-phosphate cytidylyltransferase [Firmicutes bacterium HGW-Firmicutes-14]|nr:MAG: glucose-1-phosphate cytidylyltransferase [Firmicutes bacterium HGW-Firmicutes-14]
MKVVILAGGLGTRIKEESQNKPKPMVEIGEMPILWHIMKIYSKYGLNNFVICLGYKSIYIKQYFSDYFDSQSDFTINLGNNSKTVHSSRTEPWEVTLIDTGLGTMTGGRVKRIRPFNDHKTFMLTYGDGLADVNIHKLLAFHKKHGKLATVTVVKPEGRFGTVTLTDNGLVDSFQEKARSDSPWINIGYFVMEPGVFDYIDGDDTVLERHTLVRLAADKQLAAFEHTGFWHPMDNIADRDHLSELWKNGNAPWKVWD